MRIWRLQALGDPGDQLKLVEEDNPTARDDQVVVDVEAVGLAFPDVLQCQGKYQVPTAPGHTPGGEIAGTISAVGAAVDDRRGLRVGQRVVGLAMGAGGLAEQVALAARSVFPIPDTVTAAKAAGIPLNYATTHHALFDRGYLKAGDNLLITGAAGGTGTATIQLGKHAGANIIAVVGGEEKAEVVRGLGADHVIDHHATPDWVDTVRELGGADVAYDPVGGNTFHQVRRTMNWDGRLLVIGFVSGIPEMATNHILLKSYQVVGVHWGAAIARFDGLLEKEMTELIDLAAQGVVDPPLFDEFSFEQADQALQALFQRKTHSKLVVEV